MTISEKYRKILEKPMAEPFKGYIEELLAHIEGAPKKTPKPAFTRKYHPISDIRPEMEPNWHRENRSVGI